MNRVWWYSSRDDWADRLLYLGLICAAAGVCVSIPLMYIGLGLSLAGALLLWPEARGFLVGWRWAVLFSLWTCGCTLLSPYPIGFKLPGFVTCWIALPVWALAVARCGNRRGVLIALVSGGAVALTLGVIQFCVGFDQSNGPLRVGLEGRKFQVASGFYSHWIRFGDAMAIWSAWLMALATSATATRPALAGVAAGMGIVGVLVSGARGAVLALAAGMWGAFSTTWRRSVGAALAGVVVVLISGGILWQVWPERVRNTLNGQDGRTYIWATSWQIIKQHPVHGVGNGAYNHAAVAVVDAGLAPRNPDETVRMGNAHNSFVSLAVLYGVPGLVLWLGWLTSVVLGIFRHRQRHPAIMPLVFATLGVILVGGLTEDLAAYAASRFQLFFGLALALGLALRHTTGTTLAAISMTASVPQATAPQATAPPAV